MIVRLPVTFEPIRPFYTRSAHRCVLPPGSSFLEPSLSSPLGALAAEIPRHQWALATLPGRGTMRI